MLVICNRYTDDGSHDYQGDLTEIVGGVKIHVKKGDRCLHSFPHECNSITGTNCKHDKVACNCEDYFLIQVKNIVEDNEK